MREKLDGIRRLLLGLHKAILDSEHAAYERKNGRITSPHVLLQLVMHDPWFGWFRPISEIIVRMDEVLEGGMPNVGPDPDPDSPPTDEDAEALLRELRSLLQPAEEGEEFSVKYNAVLQREPEIILAHAHLRQLLD